MLPIGALVDNLYELYKEETAYFFPENSLSQITSVANFPLNIDPFCCPSTKDLI